MNTLIDKSPIQQDLLYLANICENAQLNVAALNNELKILFLYLDAMGIGKSEATEGKDQTNEEISQ